LTRSPGQLREHALRIWRAGVEAVRADKLVRQWVCVELRERAGATLRIGDVSLLLEAVGRIVVVGAGKAAGAMAAALEEALGEDVLRQKQVAGWANVPADCVRTLRRIHLHAARPARINEPTAEGVRGAEEILRLVAGLDPADLCVCLISGGASALLPAPIAGITLADKLAVTRHLSAAGANILELNTVRKHLSRIKGGRLAQACRAGRLMTLVISDVPGDPLDQIGSGPTVEDHSSSADALEILERYQARAAGISERVFTSLERIAPEAAQPTCTLANFVIGSLAMAVDAAAAEAKRLGYDCQTRTAKHVERCAEDVGRQLADEALRMRAVSGHDCLISGGEPVVQLPSECDRGQGGRNQQLVLAALLRLREAGAAGVLTLSGGTDGEDGPTDAAGAWVDRTLIDRAAELGLDPRANLVRCDAYNFFAPLDALIKTGPTQTNVGDLRVVLVDRPTVSPTTIGPAPAPV